MSGGALQHRYKHLYLYLQYQRIARRLKAFIEHKQTTQDYREVWKCKSGNTNSTAKAGATASPGTVSHHQPLHAHPPKLKLPSLSPDFQETVQTSVESEPPELVQKTPPKLPSTPPSPDSQKITSAIIEANSTQISSVQTLKDILYSAYDVRFEVRNDAPCLDLLYKEQEEEKWVPIRVYVLKDESDDSDEEYDLDYIRSCKRISYFKKDHPTPIAYQTRTRLKQTDS